jgi:hypothetical protein
MDKYRVTVIVDYVVSAESLSKAIDIVSENSEHPLVGQYEVGYCEDVQVIGGAKW